MTKIWEILLCLGYMVKHKYYVFKIGLKLRVPILQLLVHDLSKLYPSEIKWHIQRHNERMGRTFYYKDNYAQLLHYKKNRHHWQAWLFLNDKGEIECIEIPNKYIRELLTDWIAASLSKNGKNDLKEWYNKNKNIIKLHPNSRRKLEKIMLDLKLDL